ncbi:MAG: hypothetical protein JRC99_00095 [Deltaproteobacteria bacterium]|nr:hypothetical protein [Deltaproteobacteria bacterium]
MKRKYYAKVSALDLPEGDLPKWYLIFPKGEAQLEGGPKYSVTKESWISAKAHIDRRGNDLVFDYEHQTMTGKKAPASGWIKDWRYDDKGIWAKVEWTEIAKEHLNKREYRYFSPVFTVAKINGKLELTRIYNCALTNDPKTNNINALVASYSDQQEVDVDLLAALIALSGLGLVEGATEKDAVAMITAKLTELADKEAVKPTVISAKVATALGLSPEVTEPLVLAKLTTMTAAATGEAESAGRIEVLEAKLAGQEAEKLMAKFSDRFTPDMLKQQNAQGEPLFLSMAISDPANFEIVAASMMVQLPAKLPDKQKEVKTPGDLDEYQLQVAKQFGHTKEQMLEYGQGAEE